MCTKLSRLAVSKGGGGEFGIGSRRIKSNLHMGRRLCRFGERRMRNSECKGPRHEQRHSLGTREEIYGEKLVQRKLAGEAHKK